MPIFSWSALVFGFHGLRITGSGNHALEHDDLADRTGSRRWSSPSGPRRRDVASMKISRFHAGWLACICRMRPMRSLPSSGCRPVSPDFSDAE